MSVTAPSHIKAKHLFVPALGGNALAIGLVATAAISATRQSYTNGTVSFWNTPNRFNSQGQKWAAITSGNPAAGVQNRATPRNLFGNYFAHNTDCEFVFTGTKFDVQVWGTAAPSGKVTGFDLQVWVENGAGRMIRVTPLPVGDSTTAMRYFNVDFGQPYNGRVKITCGACTFVGVGHESSAIVRPAPDRIYGIVDGDSYVEGQQAQNAGAATASTPEIAFFCMNIPTLLWERTGFIWPSRAQGATGFFKNGSGTVTDDTFGLLGSSRFLSNSRRNWMVNAGPAPFDFDQKPLFFLLNGTWNDADGSGGQTPMYARAKTCYQWVTGQDPWVTMVHATVEPYWGDAAGGFGAAGAVTGPPTAGSAHALNVAGHIQAAAEVPRTYIINPFGPTNPWFTGKGDFTTLATDTGSQQARLTGSDHIHGVYQGYWNYAWRIAEELGEIPVPLARAYRQV